MLQKIARWSYRKRWLVLIIWVLVMVGLNAGAKKAGDAFSTDFRLKGDSQEATDLLKSRFPAQAGGSGNLVFKASDGVTDPTTQTGVTEVINQIAQVPHVVAVQSPYLGRARQQQISLGGKIAFAEIQFDKDAQSVPKSSIDRISDIVTGAKIPGVELELSGEAFASQKPPGSSEAIGIFAAVIILLISFGSVLAMGLPIMTALFGIGTGLAIVNLLSHVMSLPTFATELAAMIGIGVGIDYALLIVTRYRQSLKEGHEPEEAVVTAINTAGRSVLFAGTTVVISLAGMLLMGISFIQGLGIGAAAVVLVTMAASITLLPAVLGFVGTNIDKFKIPGIGKEKPREQQFWYRWSHFLQRRPWQALIVGLVVLLALATPFLSIRLGSSDASSRPNSDTTKRAYDLLSQGFGAGYNGPLILAAEISGPQDLATLNSLGKAVAATPGVAVVTPAVPNAKMDAAIIQVIPTTSPQAQGTVDLIHKLRSTVIPAATQGTDVKVHVGGVTASFADLAEVLQRRLPIFIGVVLALSFILLMVVYRSLLVPLKAVILNVLSISAAYGVLVMVFQWGWGAHWLGIGATGPIESFLPMMMFAILFGLSMDYEVFLLSRIKEEYDRTGNNTMAVADGLTATARVITAAAAIMVTVFASFAFGDQRVIKEFGIGLSVAILVDATIVRMILVPSTMELLGKANWWLPKWLHWLPVIHIDGNDVAPPKHAKQS